MTTQTIWIVVAVVVAVLLIALVAGVMIARKRRISLREDERQRELETEKEPPRKGGSYQAGGGFNFSSGTAAAPERPRAPAAPEDTGAGVTEPVARPGTAAEPGTGTAPVDETPTADEVRTPPGGTPVVGGATEARTPPGGIPVSTAPPVTAGGTPSSPTVPTEGREPDGRVIDTAEASKDPATRQLARPDAEATQNLATDGGRTRELPRDPSGAGTTAEPTAGTDSTAGTVTGPIPDTAPPTGTAPATGTEPATGTAAATGTAPTTDTASATDTAPTTSTAPPTDTAPAADTAPATDTTASGATTSDTTASGTTVSDTTTVPDVDTIPDTVTGPIPDAPPATDTDTVPTTDAGPVPDTAPVGDTAPPADAAPPADTGTAPPGETAPVAPSAPGEEIAPAEGRIGRLRGRLSRTRTGFGQSLLGLLGAGDLDDESWEDVEATLLQADLGPEMTGEVVEKLREQLATRGVRTADQVRQTLHDVLLEALDTGQDRSVHALPHDGRPAVLLVVGVNGTGKTTTTGKLARVLVAGGHRVTLGAADTFRAAAAEQLITWGERSGAGVVRGPEGSDPASVAFDAVKRGTDDGVDAVLLDTAGRLHTKTGLMDELGKVKRVVEKQARVDEVILVLDATTGQNGLTQARVFGEVVDVTGIALTKLDGTAKGGIVFRVQRELGVPVKLVGLGEGPDDLAPFEPKAFVDALLN